MPSPCGSSRAGPGGVVKGPFTPGALPRDQVASGHAFEGRELPTQRTTYPRTHGAHCIPAQSVGLARTVPAPPSARGVRQRFHNEPKPSSSHGMIVLPRDHRMFFRPVISSRFPAEKRETSLRNKISSNLAFSTLLQSRNCVTRPFPSHAESQRPQRLFAFPRGFREQKPCASCHPAGNRTHHSGYPTRYSMGMDLCGLCVSA